MLSFKHIQMQEHTGILRSYCHIYQKPNTLQCEVTMKTQNIKNAFQFSVSEEVMKELYKILEEYIAIHINMQLQTRDFNKKIKF